MLYFGRAQVLPVFESISVPLGLVCLECSEHFTPADQGLVMPWETEDGLASCACHLKCFIENVIGYPTE